MNKRQQVKPPRKLDPLKSVTLRVPISDALSNKLLRAARAEKLTVPELVTNIVRTHLRAIRD